MQEQNLARKSTLSLTSFHVFVLFRPGRAVCPWSLACPNNYHRRSFVVVSDILTRRQAKLSRPARYLQRAYIEARSHTSYRSASVVVVVVVVVVAPTMMISSWLLGITSLVCWWYSSQEMQSCEVGASQRQIFEWRRKQT